MTDYRIEASRHNPNWPENPADFECPSCGEGWHDRDLWRDDGRLAQEDGDQDLLVLCQKRVCPSPSGKGCGRTFRVRRFVEIEVSYGEPRKVKDEKAGGEG